MGRGVIMLTEPSGAEQWLDLLRERSGRMESGGQLLLRYEVLPPKERPPPPPQPLGPRETLHKTKSFRPDVSHGRLTPDYSSLDIQIIEAKNLAKTDLIGKVDPYVELCWGGGKAFKRTKTIDNTQNPRWNETWNGIRVPEDIDYVTLMVYDEDPMDTFDFLGMYRIPLDETARGDKWVNLLPRDNNKEDLQMMKKNKKTLGQLHFKVNYTPGRGATLVRPDSGFREFSSAAPLPTRLKLRIVCAENLISTDTNGKADPYVVFCLNRKTAEKKHRTSVKKSSLSPVWDETFLLSDLDESITSITFQIFDSDAFSKDDFMGQARLDTQLREDGEHWLLLVPRPNDAEDMRTFKRVSYAGKLLVRTEWSHSW
eukprot:NODE_1749_length_1418_cov_48.151936_g1578_i0.p1 GENE.NODE_1749_length_1418_cov_48.151936_g1578_i0~~NODE_1749_length_1418_cov_48.151936_g1578_i0.p1  ORF type:complete len:417 (-),score=72.82 NODE_1749_length_1418_cov_48.151936_g1578_i0:167-1276(-)